jgi:hypothetical protein
MDAVLPNAQSSFTGMNSGCNNDNYAGAYGALDFPDPDLSMPLGADNSRYAQQKPIMAIQSRLTSRSLSFDDAMSAFTNQDPADRKPDFTMDPMSAWPPGPSRACETPSTSSRHDSAYSSAGTPKSSGSTGLESSGMMPYPSLSMPPTTTATNNFGMAAYSNPAMPPTTTATEGFAQMPYPTSVSPRTIHPSSPDLQSSAPEEPTIQQESDSTCRARYAANQRHQKARKLRQEAREASSSGSDASSSSNSGNKNAQTLTKAEEKKRNLREKNKVAAAKCRQRQRKQAETIRSKGSRLGETNAQLKSYVQELRGELNALRSLALGHGECDERLARYNQVQAERVMREYYSACGGLAGSMMNGREQQQVEQQPQ